MGILLPIVLLGLLVIGGVAVARRIMGKSEKPGGQGSDIIPYLLLALAVGVAGFAVASLAATAFPSEDFVIDVSGRVANSLAGIVVATPLAVFLWRRQEDRRAQYPASPGWTVYLALMETVFMTALVVAGFGVFEWILGERAGAGWTNVVVFGGFVAFHEWATSRTPPLSDSAELPRVVGSAIGLVPLVFGLGGLIGWLLSEVYATFTPTAGGSDLGTSVSLILAGAPVWAYRWLRPWPSEPATPRNAWMAIVTVTGLTAALGSLTLTGIQTLLYLFTATDPAGEHFEFLPAAATAVIVGLAVWAHHRQRLGAERSNAVRAYEYAMTAIGLLTAVGGAVGLSTAAFGPDELVGRRAEAAISLGLTLVVGAGVWFYFWRRASLAPREQEAPAPPRRFYLIGGSIVFGLASAGALIGTLVVLFQSLLGDELSDTLVVQASLFVFAGLATWHLLATNAEDRELIVSEESLTPFNVTIVCSHPGMIANQFPDVAKLRVIYRDDEAGVIDEEMGRDIVAAIGNRSSVVWVDSDGFRVAPAR